MRTHDTPGPGRILPEGSIVHCSAPAHTGRFSRRLAAALAVALILASSAGPHASAADGKQRRFSSPDEAMTALVDAIKTHDRKVLTDILGPEGRTLVSSGDEVADRRSRELFAAEYDRAHRIEGGGGKVVLYVTGRLPVPDPAGPGRPVVALRHESGEGRDPRPPHRAERAQRRPGVPGLRRRPARVLRRGP